MIPSGIHFGLDDESYHADPALGSTGLKRLLQSAPDFWWQSPMNPAREPEKDTPAKLFGKAVHKAVLEGREAFEASYAREPSPDYYPGCLVTVDDLKNFLGARGAKVSGKKAELIDRARRWEDCPAIFDEVVDGIEKSGKRKLPARSFDHILAAAAFIRANPHLGNAFVHGAPEVSVFWETNGQRFKARFDYLKLNAIADLKSIRIRNGREFRQACTDRIAQLDYPLSAEHYMDGRRQMARLIADGAVFGDHDPEWLARVAANEVFAFVFVFWQAEGSPISHGIKLSPGNPTLAYARHWITRAVETYQRFMADFGPDTAWVLADPLQELDETDMPVWWQMRQSQGR